MLQIIKAMIKLHRVSLLQWFLFLSLLSFHFSMECLRVGSLNINGGRDRKKLAMVSEFLKIKQINVAFLQETHTDNNNEIEWGMWWGGKLVLSHGSNNSAGVAILFSKNMNVNILNVEEIEKGRIILTKIEFEGFLFA